MCIRDRSSATPVVSGVIALMLDANSTLTYRDIEHILVRTARRNDEFDADWTTNAAGHDINHKYGFGAIDALLAVETARTWNNVNDQTILDFGETEVNEAIPEDGTSLSFDIDVPEFDADGNSIADFRIEHTLLDFDVDHSFGGDLLVTLTSPSGTTSVLTTPHNDATSPNGFQFSSVRNWDESPVGTWVLNVSDVFAEDSGQLEDIRLSLTGSTGSPNNEPVTVGSTGIISGVVFNDANANSSQEVSEEGLADRIVFLDANDNGQFDNNEPFTQTTGNGTYIFSGLASGTFNVGLACSDGFNTTSPASGTITVSLSDGEFSFGNDFGDSMDGSSCNAATEIVGNVYEDLDGDNVQDDNEEGIEGMIAYLDLNDDCIIGLGEPAGYTDASGEFRIRDLTPGTFTVRLAPEPGRPMDLPCNGLTVQVLENGSVIGSALSFGLGSNFDNGSNPTAQHGVVPGFHLGDANRLDDGVFFVSGIHPGETEQAVIFAEQLSVSRGFLHGWIDFNGDGDWNDAGEQIFQNQRLEDGQNTLDFFVPANATGPAGLARFRWALERDLAPTGDALAGEVEDYFVFIPSDGDTGLRAADDTASVDEGSALTVIDVLANDFTGPLGGSLTIESVSSPTSQGGTVAIVDGMVQYTPAANFAGQDTFTYTVIDGLGGSATATVTITVQFPVAIDDQFLVSADSTNNVLDVLANDLDAPGGTTPDDEFTIIDVGAADGGVATVTADGMNILFTPNAGFTGTTTFEYTIQDRFGGTSVGLATVSVQDEQPIVRLSVEVTDLSGNPIGEVNIGQQFQIRGFTQDLRDNPQGVFSAYWDVTFADSDAITLDENIVFSATYPNNQEGNFGRGLIDEVGAVAGSTDPIGGGRFLMWTITATATGAGTIDFNGDPADVLPIHETTVYGLNSPVPSPLIDFTGDSVSVILVGAVSDTATFVEDSSNNRIEVLANDMPPAGAGPLTLVSVSDPDNGTATVDGSDVLYTPSPDFTGTDTFTYIARDQNGVEYTGTISVNVSNINDDPNAIADTVEIIFNSLDNTINVLANDTSTPDPAEDLIITAVGDSTQNGTVTIAGDQSSVIYTPPVGFIGTDQFTYTISDQNGGTSQATVTVNVVEQASEQLAAFIFDVTDLNGNPLGMVETGDQFRVEVLVQDLTADARGVFSAYLDVLYNSTLVSFNGPIDFNDTVYPSAQKGDFSVPGIIDELGAVDGVTFLNTGDPVLLATLTFTANSTGVAEFNGDPADLIPPNETVLFGASDIVQPNEMTFVSDSITIVGPNSIGRTFTNMNSPTDVNRDGFVTPVDALFIINELNFNGARELPPFDSTRSSSIDSMIDVNADGWLSPIDALLVINDLESQNTATEPAPLSASSDDGSLTIEVGAEISPESTTGNQNSESVVESNETTRDAAAEADSTNAERDAFYANQFAQIDDSDEESRDKGDWLNNLLAGDWESYLLGRN